VGRKTACEQQVRGATADFWNWASKKNGLLAGKARGVKGTFPDFGCWAESLGIEFFTIFPKIL
jgi:hypothetical protein